MVDLSLDGKDPFVDPRREEKHELFMIVTMALLGLLTVFVETMLVPALPRIAQDLIVRSSDLAWVLTAYTLAGAVSIPIAGKLGETWGRKRVLLVIMLIYMIGLVGAALSWDLLSLVIFRAVQGAGMGAITLLMGMAKDVLPPRMVPVGIGLISAMMGVGAALGMVMGSVIISFIGWKESFWVVLPIVILVVTVVERTIPDTQVRRPAKLDAIGSILLTSGLLALLLALSQGELWGWGSTAIIGLFICAIILFMAFALQERRHEEPIIRLEVFKNCNISVAYITMFFIGLVMFMLYQTLPYFLGISSDEGGFGITDQVVIGLFMLPNAVAQLISSPLGGKWGLKAGHGKILILGMFLSAAGLLVLSAVSTSAIGILLTVAIFGFGIGLAQTGNTNLISCVCSKENFGSTTAVNSMILTIGMSVGPVLAGLISEGYADVVEGYNSAWIVAAMLSIIAGIFVLLNRAKLSSGPMGTPALEEKCAGNE